MLKVNHVSSGGGAKKSKFQLPESYDGSVHEGAMYHAVRAFLANRRQGTASTKTRGEVSGGSRKPWRQKGTGRARAGTTRAAHWRGGGVVFGPKPRSYHVKLPRKVKQLARQSALNARASEGALHVIESLDFEQPKTRLLLDILGKMKLAGQRVLVLTAKNNTDVYLSGRNLQHVHVMPYVEASTYEVLWSQAVVIEQPALAGKTNDAEDVGGDDA